MARSKDTGIYVICSDQSLLDKVNKLFRRQGVIGVTDAEGKTHYMVDARRSKNQAARQINEFVNNMREDDEFVDYKDKIAKGNVFDEVVDDIFLFYGFDISLLGTQALIILASHMVYMKDERINNVKDFMMIASRALELNYNQLERNIRYAIKKSKFKDMNLRTVVIIRLLANAIRVSLRKEHLI